MPLTTEERVELMKRAREAKANKKLAETPVVNVEQPVEQPPPPKVKKTRKKQEAVLPEPVQLVIESESEEDVIEAPAPAPKKKALPAKWLKNPKTEPEKVCCDAKLTKEKPVIDDAPQVVEEKIVIPSKTTLKKPRAPRASTPSRTLTLTEPPPITELIQELEQADKKYRPVQVRQVPPPSAPIQIKRVENAFKLFDY